MSASDLAATAVVTTHELATSTSDPSVRLPVEIFHQILREAPTEVKFQLRRVSRRWNKLIDGAPSLWNSLSWGHGPPPYLSNEALELCLILARNEKNEINLRRLHLEGHGDQRREACELVFSRISDLRSLSMSWVQVDDPLIKYASSMRNLTSIKLSYNSRDRSNSQKHMAEVLGKFPSLRSATLRGFTWDASPGFCWPQGMKNLRQLSMETWTCPGPGGQTYSTCCGYPFDHHRLVSLASGAPNLTKLSLVYTCRPEGGIVPDDLDFSGFKKLEELSVQHVTTTLVPRLLPSSLKRFRWSTRGTYDVKERMQADYSDIPSLPNLEALQVATCPAREFWLRFIAKSNTSLRSLELWAIGCSKFSMGPEDMVEADRDWERRLLLDLLYGNHLVDLKRLVIRCQGVDEWLAGEIAAHCPQLETLVVNINHGFSKQSIDILVNKPGTPLRKLILCSLFWPSTCKPDLVNELRRDLKAPLQIQWHCEKVHGESLATGSP